LGLIIILESVGVLGVEGHCRVVYVLYKFSHSVILLWSWFFSDFGISPLYSCVLWFYLIHMLIGDFGGKDSNILNW